VKQKRELIDQRLVQALAHPLRVQILEILCDHVASPNALSADLGAGLSHVAYHTRALNRCGCLELVETAQRRGATEHFYKAAPNAFLGDRAWRRVPRSLRGSVNGASLQTLIDTAVTALDAGTIDGREDTTLTWMPLRVDCRGWKEVTQILEEATERVLKAQARSARRLAKRDGEEISTVVAIANFETAGSRRQPS
jgi:DNA-binding transcriptional ArsR family regulator